MTTPRLFRKSFSPSVQLTDTEAKHLFQVLRKQTGDAVEIVFETDSSLFTATLYTDLKSAEDLIAATHKAKAVLDVSVAIPLLKGGGTEEVIDAATQLGVSTIHIYEAKHSVARFGDKQDAKRIRFQACAESASSQSKRVSVPHVQTYTNLQSFLAGISEVQLLCCVIAATKPVTATQGLQANRPVAILVGPEGDFSKDELSLLAPYENNFITLGPTILRAVLAPVVAVVQVQQFLENQR